MLPAGSFDNRRHGDRIVALPPPFIRIPAGINETQGEWIKEVAGKGAEQLNSLFAAAVQAASRPIELRHATDPLCTQLWRLMEAQKLDAFRERLLSTALLPFARYAWTVLLNTTGAVHPVSAFLRPAGVQRVLETERFELTLASAWLANPTSTRVQRLPRQAADAPAASLTAGHALRLETTRGTLDFDQLAALDGQVRPILTGRPVSVRMDTLIAVSMASYAIILQNHYGEAGLKILLRKCAFRKLVISYVHSEFWPQSVIDPYRSTYRPSVSPLTSFAR